VVPFRDRWVGNTQTIEGRQNIEAMRELAPGIPVLASIRESEKFKNAIRQGNFSPTWANATCNIPLNKSWRP
jgi:chromosome partitioning protein